MALEASRNNVRPAAVLGGCLLIGLLLCGWVLGAQIKAMKQADRYVTVKGLVERTVKADRGSWSVSFKEAGDDLPSVYQKSATDKNTVIAFFHQQGFSDSELTVGQVSASDRETAEYSNGQHLPRFTVTQSVNLITHDVDKLARAGQQTDKLVQQGIVIAGGAGVQYQFTGLNALKPDMITEATRNARSSADRFAADSGAKVGSIRSANQGTFSISAPDAAAAALNPEEGSDSSSEASSIMKKVRVVATIDYYLTN